MRYHSGLLGGRMRRLDLCSRIRLTKSARPTEEREERVEALARARGVRDDAVSASLLQLRGAQTAVLPSMHGAHAEEGNRPR